jgi:hypothetical protein
MQVLSTKNMPSNNVTYDYKNLTLLSKDQVLQLLSFLTERINRNFIMMGGLLYTIRKNKWFDPYATFAEFCDTLVGIQYRKSMYLIQIYEALMTNKIPFDEVANLGFTKLTLLSAHLNEHNYKTMIEWAAGLTTQEIEDELKATVIKAKGFIDKAKGAESLSPDYKESSKVVKGDLSGLKQLLIVNPIETVVQALRMLYPTHDFSIV